MARTGAITIKRCGHHCDLVHPDPAEAPNRPAEPRAEPATAAGLTDALRELIRVSKSAGMNAMSEFGYLTSTQMADDEEISEAVQGVHAAIEAEARAAASASTPPALDAERLADVMHDGTCRWQPHSGFLARTDREYHLNRAVILASRYARSAQATEEEPR